MAQGQRSAHISEMTVAMTTFGDIAAMAWLTTHPSQTFALGGYSQGAEAASRVLAPKPRPASSRR